MGTLSGEATLPLSCLPSLPSHSMAICSPRSSIHNRSHFEKFSLVTKINWRKSQKLFPFENLEVYSFTLMDLTKFSSIQVNFRYCIRRSFPLSKMTANNIISPMKFCCNTSFPFLNNPKDLDLSQDFWDCFERKNSHLITKEIWPIEVKVLLLC